MSRLLKIIKKTMWYSFFIIFLCVTIILGDVAFAITYGRFTMLLFHVSKCFMVGQYIDKINTLKYVFLANIFLIIFCIILFLLFFYSKKIKEMLRILLGLVILGILVLNILTLRNTEDSKYPDFNIGILCPKYHNEYLSVIMIRKFMIVSSLYNCLKIMIIFFTCLRDVCFDNYYV